MMRSSAKKAMTTRAQKACFVLDHLIEALGNDASSSLRRAAILVDIDQNPGTTQSEIMDRLHIHKSAMNREIEWLYDYGCVMRQESRDDGRAVRLETCGYARKALSGALDYFEGSHKNLQIFLKSFNNILKQEKPTLRDAKIIAALYELRDAPRQEVLARVPGSTASSSHRAYNTLVQEGLIDDG
ncbi:MAG: MarR family transcriptional regulator [Alphaproteobacteria bacterium]|nr:MarR family transcriptional regulator [Alphaproteobacteria bacterium]